MTGTHLSDQELQTYLTEKNSCSKELLEHVHSCAHCQMAAAVYKQLFVAIKNDAAPGFDFDVAEMVVAKGKVKDGDFMAKDILTKCPSKDEGTGQQVKSTNKN